MASFILGELPPLTNGQLIIGSTGQAPVAASLTAGAGISITPSAGGISIANTSPGSSPSANYWVPRDGYETSVFSALSNGVNASQVGVVRVFIPFSISITSINFEVTTGQAASNSGVSIYDATGTTKLVDGTIATATATVKSIVIGAVVLPAGVYLLAVNSSANNVVFRCFTFSAGANPALNAVTQQIFTAANTAVAGVNPATLGVLTATTLLNLPYIKFQS